MGLYGFGGVIARVHILRDTFQQVHAELVVIFENDAIHHLRLHGMEPGDIAAKMLQVGQRPFSAGSTVGQVSKNGSLDNFVFAVADGDFVVFVEHNAEDPVAPGTGIELGFRFVNGEGSADGLQQRYDITLSFFIVEHYLAGDIDIIGIAGITAAVGDNGAVRIALAGVKLVKHLGHGVIKRNHHDVCQKRADGRTLRQTAVEHTQIERFGQKLLTARIFQNEVKGVNQFHLGEDEVGGGGGEEAVKIEVGEPPAVEPLMLFGNLDYAAFVDIGISASMVVGKHPAGQNVLELVESLFEFRERGINGTQAAGLFGNLEMVIEFIAGLVVQIAVGFDPSSKLRDHLGNVGDAHNTVRDTADHNRVRSALATHVQGFDGEVLPGHHFFKR